MGGPERTVGAGGREPRPALGILLSVRSLTDLRFDNSYARLSPAFYEVVDPTPLPAAYLVAFNPSAAALLGLDPAVAQDPELPVYLSGGKRIPGSEPIAEAYAGHQFGVWVPQLGDGRAFLLGEVRNGNESWDLHLKGGGRTRYSRFGDGRAVLRSVVREYLASEALHGLGIPTTRGLSIVGSDLPVQRETVETAATLIRLSPSHVRFGTFELFASRGQDDRLRELVNYVVERHYPELRGAEDRARRLFGTVCKRTGALMARWMAAGFAHGVMNTDNFSILGITLDYGPYGFLDDYDPGFICNHTDVDGRYAFDRQPAVGMWNCARLGEALMATGPAGLSDIPAASIAAWQTELDTYWPAFVSEYALLLRAKLGLATEQAEDGHLVRDLLTVLRDDRLDYTRFFRALGGLDPAAGTWNWPNVSPALRAWSARYAERLRREGRGDVERQERMRRANPKYVLRNWIAQEAIERAEHGEFAFIEELRNLLADPFAEHPEMDRYSEPPSPAAREISVSCSS